MTQLLDSKQRRILVNDLVDRHHGAEIEEHFDDFIALDRHTLREFGHCDIFRNFNLTNDRRRRFFESVL